MAIFLGVDTGGTYTDAVVLDDSANQVLASAKSLTTRADLSLGIGRAVDAALAKAAVRPDQIAMVSLSTTLATNALVEGQGGRVALVFIGFDAADLNRGGLVEALKGDPVIQLAGGHGHSGAQVVPFDMAGLERALTELGDSVSGFAIAASFGVRNPAHEIAARDAIRARTGRPVTCAHELSARLNGPKRALTAVLNARLIGMIDRLVTGCEQHLSHIGIVAPLMVVRGDGALISAAMVRERPIETILSGPAASIEGARWLTGEDTALVSDIGGTTTDVALLRNGRPEIDPMGARVGEFRTMVEAVAMRTTGLGGDSEVSQVNLGLGGSLFLGPRRLIPVALMAQDFPDLVHPALDRALAAEAPGEHDGRFVLPMPLHGAPAGLAPREEALLARIGQTPCTLASVLTSRMDEAALTRLVARGAVMISGVTPSDASHVLDRLDSWDGAAAQKALTLFARKRDGKGERIASDSSELAQRIIDQLTAQTVECLLEAAFDEDRASWGDVPAKSLARHPLTHAGLDRHQGLITLQLALGVPVIGLGASAPSYYGAVGARLGTRMILPEHAGVANAIGAVVGQISMRAEGAVTARGPGRFAALLAAGPQDFSDRDAALSAMETALRQEAKSRALAAGAQELRFEVTTDLREAMIEGQPMFIEARIMVTAMGRPRSAVVPS